MEKSEEMSPAMNAEADKAEETPTANPAATPDSAEEADLLKKTKDELAEAKDKYVRLYAEFDNFRRRSARERLELIQTANEKLLRELLSVADDFERAARSMTEKSDKDLEGFSLIHTKFKKVLEQNGLKPMEPQKGKVFDADMHEAITQIPAPAEEEKGKVLEVVEQGYYLHDKVLRYAKVVVGS